MKEKRWRVDPELSFPELMERLRNTTTAQKAVALYLAVHEMERTAPTLNELQKDMGIGRSTIERAMPTLRHAGIIQEAQQGAKSKRRA